MLTVRRVCGSLLKKIYQLRFLYLTDQHQYISVLLILQKLDVIIIYRKSNYNYISIWTMCWCKKIKINETCCVMTEEKFTMFLSPRKWADSSFSEFDKSVSTRKLKNLKTKSSSDLQTMSTGPFTCKHADLVRFDSTQFGSARFSSVRWFWLGSARCAGPACIFCISITTGRPAGRRVVKHSCI